MDQALIGAAVGATIQVVLQNVLSVSIEEIERVYGFKKDLSKLKESLELIQDFLCDAETKQVNDRAVKRWLGRLEDVAFKADAVLDEFNYDLLRKKVKKQKGETNKVTTFFPRISHKLLFSIKMAYKIKDVNNELERINKEASSFGLQAAITSAGHYCNVGLNTHHLDFAQTNSFYVETNIIGRDDDVLNIVDLLIRGPSDRTFFVIPILGMGGLGKTTLARKVFHHEKIGAHFEKKIWVCVSVSSDAMALFKMILEALSRESVQGMQSEEAVLENIQKNLAGKKYLIVLDDVWNENSDEWDYFLSSLSGVSSVKGNCIVVTTRSGIVASNVQTLPTPPLQKLSGDDCWSVIKSKAFPRETPIEFEEVGKRIAERCGGLPLAAKVVGGLLCGKSKDEWQSILTNQLSGFGPDGTVRKILKLSYDRLPSFQHKRCFAYCSIFPQDYIIKPKQLIELWMAEGFLQTDERKDMETIGDEIFNHFMQNSLFQDGAWDKFGNILCCKMHDLVHDLSCSITKGMHQVRYLASTDESDAISQDQINSLRTLFLSGKSIPIMLQDLKCLYILNLNGVKIEVLPTVIGKLIHLRFLNISNTGVERLPDSIGKLYNLQSLWMEILRLKILPDSIIDLISLRHLHYTTYTQLPPGIGKLTSLQTLECYKVGNKEGCRIGELGKLTKLQGDVEIQNLERVKDKEEAKEAWFSRKKIFRLVFKWNESREDDQMNDINVLDGLQPHPSLKSLEMIGYGGRSFPPWTMNMKVHNDIQDSCELLHNLIDIKLQNCKRCEEVPMLGHLPHLKFLTLDGLSNLQAIGCSFYGVRNDNTSSLIGETNYSEPMIAFPALEELKLFNMLELTEWTEVEGVSVFPCLKYLEIKACPKLRSVPSHFPYLKELKVYEVDAEFSLLDVCCSTSYLQSITISFLPGLTYFPEELLVKNQILRKLRIGRCYRLTRLDLSSLGGGSSLEQLEISDCPKLELAFPSAKGFTSLRRFEINSCENLRELPLDLDTIQSLEVLVISGCPEVESISPCVKGLTALRNLIISSCQKLKEIPLDLNGHRSLEELTISGCPEVKSIFSYARAGGGGDLQSQQKDIITSLRKMRISGCSGLIDLPSELFESCSSTLLTLVLEGLGNLENLDRVLLPCLSRMSSLQQLTLVCIPKLMNFPIKEICCSLRRLDIGGFSDSMSLDSFNQHLRGLLQESHSSLGSLFLYGKEDWDSLPDQIQHLTALKTLHLIDFGRIEALPEWIRNFSSLEYLFVVNCKRLSHLPSKEAMLSLTNLHDLCISNCPLLVERCRKHTGSTTSIGAAVNTFSEWPKISHIKCVSLRFKSII